MDNRSSVFDDPNGKFKVQIPSGWKYHKKEASGDEVYPCQFEINEHSSFQISCRKINDVISELIEVNKLEYHDFNLPNLTFHEFYGPSNKHRTYLWMRPIEDHFILSMYIFDPSKVGKELGLTLMDIRLLLQNLAYKKNDGKWWLPNKMPPEDIKDFYNIEAWQGSPARFFKFMSSSDKTKVTRVAPLDIDVVKLYALLKLKISNQPNGFYTLVSVGRPLDNMIWWDFILESRKGFIQIWRTPHIIEAMYEFDDGAFDLQRFLHENVERHIKPILDLIKTFESHTVYINHYKSYKEFVRSLWKQIKKIDLSEPTGPAAHLAKREELDEYHKDIRRFIKNSVKFHTLGKSMVLNAAFEIESFLNLIIRVGSIPQLKGYQEVIDKYLRADFMYRVRNLGFHVDILGQAVDTKHQAVKDANELMILRNKYVHFEEDTAHNKIGEVAFDNDFPLHSVSKGRPAVDTVKQIFHRPDFKTVQKAYQTANNFVKYIQSLIHPQLRKSILYILEQNPISYNESRGVYSSVYTPMSLDFFNIEVPNEEQRNKDSNAS